MLEKRVRLTHFSLEKSVNSAHFSLEIRVFSKYLRENLTVNNEGVSFQGMA